MGTERTQVTPQPFQKGLGESWWRLAEEDLNKQKVSTVAERRLYPYLISGTQLDIRLDFGFNQVSDIL